jgi:molybdopterin converting factor subunit 1
MTIDVHLFARARDIAGTSRLAVALPDGATVGDLRRRLGELLPNLARLLEHSVLAVDNEVAGDALVLAADVEVALLPPVSGG